MIPQSEYVSIATNVVASRPPTSMAALVLTTTAANSAYANKTSFDSGNPHAMTLTDVATAFGTSSNEYKLATRFFSYRPINGFAPASIYFARASASTTAAHVSEFNKCVGKIDFRTVTISKSVTAPDSTADSYCSIINGIATAAKGYEDGNYYRIVAGFAGTISPTTLEKWTSPSNTTLCKVDITENSAYPNKMFDHVISMAICASTNYDMENGTVTQFGKQSDGAYPAITELSSKNDADISNLNYFADVRGNGNSLVFYQMGVNFDGKDTAESDDAAWLSREIQSQLMNYMLSVAKIPANADGIASVIGTVIYNAERGIRNGIIVKNKTLTPEAIAIINSYSSDSDAVEKIENNGYIVGGELVKEGDKYKILYRLIYASGVGVKKIDGMHTIV